MSLVPSLTRKAGTAHPTAKESRRYIKQPKWGSKICFGEREKCQNLATKWFPWTWIYVFLPSFVEIHKAELTKTMVGIHHKKRLLFCPLLQHSWSDLTENLQGHSFPIPHPSTKFHPNSSSILRYTWRSLLRSLQYQHEACMLLTDNNITIILTVLTRISKEV